jgi:hypothetical protein
MFSSRGILLFGAQAHAPAQGLNVRADTLVTLHELFMKAWAGVAKSSSLRHRVLLIGGQGPRLLF